MTVFTKDLFQFSSYVPMINLSFHQYLLAADEPVLFHTGNVEQAKALVPQLKSHLAGKDLGYMFVSHFESDECGGIAHILEHFPEAKIICSEVTARQLSGFGFVRQQEVIIKKPGEKFETKDYELEFFSYPSEMHLWEGILVMENRRKIFFSSDLMIRFGDSTGTVIESDWNTEIAAIRPDQVPDPARLAALQKTLIDLSPKFVATGHGPCLLIKS